MYPGYLTPDKLLFSIYSGRDSEPEYSTQVLRAIICRLRKELKQYGWTIPPNKSGPGNAAHYRLVPWSEPK